MVKLLLLAFFLLSQSVMVFADVPLFLGVRTKSDQFLFDATPKSSKYLKIYEGGFKATKEEARYYCLWDITQKRDFPIYVHMEMDNPISKNEPLVEDGVISPQSKSLYITSRNSVKGLKIGGVYHVKVSLYKDENKTILIDHLDQPIKSYLDTTGKGVKVR